MFFITFCSTARERALSVGPVFKSTRNPEQVGWCTRCLPQRPRRPWGICIVPTALLAYQICILMTPADPKDAPSDTVSI